MIRSSIATRAIKIVVLLMSLAFAAALLWFNFHGNGQHAGLLTGVLLVLLYSLISTGIVPVPQGYNIPLFTVWPRLSDSVKAVVSFSLMFLWTPLAMRLVPDTYLGVAIILIPDGVFILAALVFVSNGISRNLP